MISDITNPKIEMNSSDMDVQLIVGEKRIHICSYCNKTFKSKCLLEKHQMIHTKVQLYQYSQCNKGFTNKSNLIRHQKTHTGDKPFQCSHCNKAFAQKVRIHTENSHWGEAIPVQ